MDPQLDYTREASSRYQELLVQDPYDQRNAARAINSRKQREKIEEAFMDSDSLLKEKKNCSFYESCHIFPLFMSIMMARRYGGEGSFNFETGVASFQLPNSCNLM